MNITKFGNVRRPVKQRVGSLVKCLLALPDEEIGKIFRKISTADVDFWSECSNSELEVFEQLLRDMFLEHY